MKQLYGLIGRKLTHSFSRSFFNERFFREGIDAEYLNFEMDDVSDLRKLVAEMPGLIGLNVTIPFKRDVIDILDEVSAEALQIGAVNVIEIRRDNGLFLVGHNTDVIGFGDMLDAFAQPVDSRALVMGTGGASLAVKAAFAQRNIKVTTVSRVKSQHAVAYEDLTPGIIADHRFIVNATPLGTFPNNDTCVEIPYTAITGNNICIDLVYNPGTTLFMKKCADNGAVVRNGLHMLRSQAIAAWKIWTHES